MAHDHSVVEHVPEGWEPGSDADLNIPMIAFIGAIGIVTTVVIVLVLKALFYSTLTEERQKKGVSAGYLPLSDMVAQQQTQLQDLRWVDTGAGTIAIPIERAMELTVSELAGQGGAPLRRHEVLVPGSMAEVGVNVHAVPSAVPHAAAEQVEGEHADEHAFAHDEHQGDAESAEKEASHTQSVEASDADSETSETETPTDAAAEDAPQAEAGH